MGAEMPANLSDMDLLMTPKKKTLSIWLLSHPTNALCILFLCGTYRCTHLAAPEISESLVLIKGEESI